MNVGELLHDIGPIPREVVEVLEQTLTWLKSSSRNPMTLRDAYENAECKRKNQRARLSRLFGAPRRMEWDGKSTRSPRRCITAGIKYPGCSMTCGQQRE